MTKIICTSLSLQSVFLYQLQPHSQRSQREYTIVLNKKLATLSHNEMNITNNIEISSYIFCMEIPSSVSNNTAIQYNMSLYCNGSHSKVSILLQLNHQLAQLIEHMRVQ